MLHQMEKNSKASPDSTRFFRTFPTPKDKKIDQIKKII